MAPGRQVSTAGAAAAKAKRKLATKQLQASPSKNLFQQAYARLRGAIEDGTLEPGRRLMEIQVSEWLQISRTPAREALRRLQSEGLLEQGPSGGLAVALHDADAVRELYAMRESLEGTAAAMAARNAEPHDIELLQEQVRIQATLRQDMRVHAHENKLFHESVYRAAHNRFLLKSVQALQDAMILLGERNFAVPGRIRSSIEEHVAIVAGIAARDPARAEEAARLHIRHGYDSRVRAMTDAFRAAALERHSAGAPPPDSAQMEALPADRPATKRLRVMPGDPVRPPRNPASRG